MGGASGDQLTLGGGEAGSERGRGDEQESGDEDASASQQVGHSPAEQQEAAEGEHVRVHDPGKVRLREVEPLTDRREGDVDNRRVENHDELREAEQRKGDPTSALELLGCGHYLPSFLLVRRVCVR